jgi:hypothetical protein
MNRQISLVGLAAIAANGQFKLANGSLTLLLKDVGTDSFHMVNQAI